MSYITICKICLVPISMEDDPHEGDNPNLRGMPTMTPGRIPRDAAANESAKDIGVESCKELRAECAGLRGAMEKIKDKHLENAKARDAHYMQDFYPDMKHDAHDLDLIANSTFGLFCIAETALSSSSGKEQLEAVRRAILLVSSGSNNGVFWREDAINALKKAFGL